MLNSLPLTKEQKKNAILPVGPSRFDPIIEGLRGHEKYPQLRVACLQLVNVLVCTPEELDFRMHLRGEFMRAGLQDCYEVSFYPACVVWASTKCAEFQREQEIDFMVAFVLAVLIERRFFPLFPIEDCADAIRAVDEGYIISKNRIRQLAGR